MAQVRLIEIGTGVDPTVYDGLVTLTRVGNALVYNAALGDTDFRIAGDTDANLLVVNAGDNSVTVGIAASAMGVKFAVSDGTDEVGFDLDGSNAILKWNDGFLRLITDEGTNTNTIVEVRGKGDGEGFFRCRDEDDLEFLEITCTAGAGKIAVGGSNPNGLRLQQAAVTEINCFLGASGSQRPKFKIYGRDQATDLKNLQIGMSSSAASTIDFSNLDAYNFDGLVSITGNLLVDGGDVGIVGQPTLLQMSAGVLQVNGTVRTGTGGNAIMSGPDISAGIGGDVRAGGTGRLSTGALADAGLGNTAGSRGDILVDSTGPTFYGCTVTGGAGAATWVALH